MIVAAAVAVLVYRPASRCRAGIARDLARLDG
jgi:hypothetical protein